MGENVNKKISNTSPEKNKQATKSILCILDWMIRAVFLKGDISGNFSKT